MKNSDQVFFAAIHDVTPQFSQPITTILDQLNPLVGDSIAAAVVPRWHGEPWKEAQSFAELVKARFGEMLLHGYTHRRDRGCSLLSWVTDLADEFAGISATAAVGRLRRGQAIIAQVFGEPALGFIPPAWQRGMIRGGLLAECGLYYCVDWTGIECVDGTRAALSTWSWDAGTVPQTGRLCEVAGAAMHALRGHSVPCVVFHPADVHRGYLPRGLALVRTFLANGRRPVTFGEIVFDDHGRRAT